MNFLSNFSKKKFFFAYSQPASCTVNEEILFHSLSTDSHIFSLLENVFLDREQEIFNQIFSIGFKLGFGPGQNISSNEFSANYFLDTLAVCIGALSYWNIIVSLILNCWTVSSILMYSFAFIDSSHIISLSTLAAVKAPHTIIPQFPCFTVVLMQLGWYFSPDLLIQYSGASLERQNFDSSD